MRLPLSYVDLPHAEMVRRVAAFLKKYQSRGGYLLQQSARMVQREAEFGRFVQRPRWTMPVEPDQFEVWSRPEPGERDLHRRSLDLPDWTRMTLTRLAGQLDVQIGRLLRLAILERELEPVIGQPVKTTETAALRAQIDEMGAEVMELRAWRDARDR